MATLVARVAKLKSNELQVPLTVGSVANTAGWGRYGRWVQTLSVEDFTPLWKLWEHGVVKVEGFADVLERAVREHPPEPAVVEVVQALVGAARAKPKYHFLLVGPEDEDS